MDELIRLLLTSNHNILGGVIMAGLAVVIGVNYGATTVRDFIFVLVFAILVTWVVIERWLLENSLVTSCLSGFAIGYIMDDIYLNLKTTLPVTVADIVGDVLKGARKFIQKLLGIHNDE